MSSRALVKFLCQVVFRILGPRQPDVVDLFVLGGTETVTELGESRQVILMLVRSDDQVQVSTRGLVDVRDYVGQFDVGVFRAQGPAVDQDMLLFAARD